MSDGNITRVVAMLVLLNLAFIGALPRIFFRKGRLNAQWWVTAAPFFLCSLVLLAALVGVITPWPLPFRTVLDYAATLVATTSVALIAFTLGTHRAPLSLWHQQDDTPARLVTHGAYARVRHPFYAAFLLALLAAAAALPHWLTGACLLCAAVQLHRTARREERRLLAAFGAEYRAYCARTGRFWPRLERFGRARATTPADRGDTPFRGGLP